MKIFGTKSLSAGIAAILNVIWWIEWVAAAAFLIVLGIAGHVRGAFVLPLPVTFSEITIATPPSMHKGFPGGVINSTSGILSITIQATLLNMTLFFIVCGFIFSTISFITYQLKMIFSNFKSNLSFNALNIHRIQNIAMVFIGYAVVQWLYVILVNRILLSQLKWHYLELAYPFNVSYALIGIILIIVAGIFKMGLSLEEEKQLTI